MSDQLMERFDQHDKPVQEINDISYIICRDFVPKKEIVDSYEHWSKSYDGDMDTPELGYNGPWQLADIILEKYGDRKDAKICDFGCGTGRVGFQLHKRGFTNLYGLDENSGMLSVAKKRGIYKGFHQGQLGTGLTINSIPDDEFDFVMSCGVVFSGHIMQTAFEELLRICKPGGHIIWMLHKLRLQCEECKDFEPRVRRFEDEGFWKLMTRQIIPDMCLRRDGLYIDKLVYEKKMDLIVRPVK